MDELTPLQLLQRRAYRARRDRGWSQLDLASEAGLSTTPVENLESGREVTFTSAARICAALGIPLEEARRD